MNAQQFFEDVELNPPPQNDVIVYRVRTQLADHEYGNAMMMATARQVFEKYPNHEPLVVQVTEHAGWSLSFLRDGTIVGTANDAAQLEPQAIQFLRDHWHSNRQELEFIDRRKLPTQGLRIAS